MYESVFSASLGPRERLLTYAVGYGVGMGVPFLLGISFAVGFSQPLLLLFPVPFMLAFGAPYFFRPTGYAVTSSEIAVIRAIGRKGIPLEAVCEILSPATSPPGISIGLARVEGIHGTFGSYWNKTWGRYQVFVTNHLNTVEVGLEDSSRVILSPDDPMAFIDAVRKAALELGITIEVHLKYIALNNELQLNPKPVDPSTQLRVDAEHRRSIDGPLSSALRRAF